MESSINALTEPVHSTFRACSPSEFTPGVMVSRVSRSVPHVQNFLFETQAEAESYIQRDKTTSGEACHYYAFDVLVHVPETLRGVEKNEHEKL